MDYNKYFMGSGFWKNVGNGIKSFGTSIGSYLGDVTGITDGKLGYQDKTDEAAKNAATATGAPVDTKAYKQDERNERAIDAELAKEEAGSVANNKANQAIKSAKNAANSAGLGKFASAQMMADAAVKGGTEGYDEAVYNEKSLAANDRAAANSRAGSEENKNFQAAQTAAQIAAQNAQNEVNNRNNLLTSTFSAIGNVISDENCKNIHSFSKLWEGK